ncbi:LOW QUALITY PROTEIN: FRG domain protein [Methylomicrobium album BG8]|uniref:FRG domain protein n=1 Tax=Methylomicrobium album BG8 TaxID=686340 RepID=H8GQV6_METAL|nr:LOW QUALITY PROTEIN: FRG domain protein [Methylomicrobium album BG8]
MKISWAEYKAIATSDLELDGAVIYRGQRLASWGLVSSVHRTALVRSIPDLKGYADYMLPRVHDALEAWVERSWDLKHSLGLAEFLAFAQHNGFPTPLLDWTASPYIAAYFAFEGVNHFKPQSERVAIFAFNQEGQVYDFADFTPHVSVLRPRQVGNHKLAVQQGCFTVTNVLDIEQHIRLNESEGRKFLTKYELDVRERPKVIRELSLMGISAVQLMPSVEAVCKKALEDLIGLVPIEPPK